MRIDDLKYDIAHARIKYGWKLLKNYGVVDTRPPKMSPSDTSLEHAIQRVEAYGMVESFDIRKEVTRDLEAFEACLCNELPPFEPQLFKDRYPGIHLEDHEESLSALALASHGIYTNNARIALTERYHTMDKDFYSLEDLSSEIGVRVATLQDYCASDMLYGKFPLINGAMEQSVARSFVQYVDSTVFYSEAVKMLAGRFSLQPRTIMDVISAVSHNKRKIAPDDPYATTRFRETPISLVHSMSLQDFSALANIMRRDERILSTHYSTPKAAEKLNLTKHTQIALLAKRGKLRVTSVSLLSSDQNNARHILVDPKVVDAYAYKQTFLSVPALIRQLKPKGLAISKRLVTSTLLEMGIMKDMRRGQSYVVPPERVSDVIDFMKGNRLVSLSYKTFCKAHNLDLDSSFEAYELHVDNNINVAS